MSAPGQDPRQVFPMGITIGILGKRTVTFDVTNWIGGGQAIGAMALVIINRKTGLAVTPSYSPTAVGTTIKLTILGTDYTAGQVYDMEIFFALDSSNTESIIQQLYITE